MLIGACSGALLLTVRAQTVLLFTARALSMGSYAILYVYTPEVGLHPSTASTLHDAYRCSSSYLFSQSVPSCDGGPSPGSELAETMTRLALGGRCAL